MSSIVASVRRASHSIPSRSLTIVRSRSRWYPSGLAVDGAVGRVYWGDAGVRAGYVYGGTVNVMNTNDTSGA